MRRNTFVAFPKPRPEAAMCVGVVHILRSTKEVKKHKRKGKKNVENARGVSISSFAWSVCA